MAELILYACPIGELADSLDAYRERARVECGANAAHAYMPHVTLTGFFRDDPAAVPIYVAALRRVIDSTPMPPDGPATVTGMLLREDFHLLTVESAWFRRLAGAFREAVTPSTTRIDAIRPKEWLHISLAYEFPAEHHDRLARLASSLVRPDAACSWEIRLYQRDEGNRWSVLAASRCPEP